MYRYLLILVLSLGLLPNVYAQKQENTLSKLANATVSDETITKLFNAVESGKLDAVKKIVEDAVFSSILVNVKNKDGMTPLMVASILGNTEIAKYLVNKKAAVNTTNNAGNPALCYALESANEKIAEILLNANAHANLKCKFEISFEDFYNDDIGYTNATPLHFAAGFEYFQRDGVHLGSHHWSASHNVHKKFSSLSLVTKMLAKGADINALDDEGRTPLWRALTFQNDEIVDYLISKGAKVPADKHGVSILQWAKKYERQELVNYLIKKGFKK